MTIDVAIVGTGGIAAAHATSYQVLADQARVVAAADVDAGWLAGFGQKWSIPRLYPDLDALLASEQPDLVSLCTPPGLHKEQALACLQRGMTVLCEKPPVRHPVIVARAGSVVR